MKEKFCEFFIETDHSLLLGFPRWMLVEAVTEEFEFTGNEMIFKNFYKMTPERPEKPKTYNFTMNEMFKLLDMVQTHLKKPVHDHLESILKRMKEKLPKAVLMNKEWISRQHEKKMKMIQEMQSKPIEKLQFTEKELEMNRLKEELMGLNMMEPGSKEKVQIIRAKLQQLENN
jgi:hypothetical protein